MNHEQSPSGEYAHLRFCTGYGGRDSHALVLNDGRPNPHSSAGQPYGTVSFADICAMITAPLTVAKEDGQWIIPSTYAGHDARSHEAQRGHGSFRLMCADIDRGNPSLADVLASVKKGLGDIQFAVYSTRSATGANQKWRVLVPLAEPLTGEEYGPFQAAWFDALEKAGLEMDRTLERTGQLVYLPNRGAFYESAFEGGPALEPRKHHMAKRAALYMETQAAMAKAGASRAEGPRSPLAAFRRKHSIPEMLAAYGYDQKPGSPHWRSPLSQSGSFSTQDRGDHWISLSHSDAEAGIGRKTSNGSRYGDAFDIYVHFGCGGNRDSAKLYAQQCLAAEDAAFAAHGREVWEAINAARSKAIEEYNMAHPLPTSEELRPHGRAYTNMPDPAPGPILDIASWIYREVMVDPHRDLAIVSALLLAAAFAGRKDSLKGNPPTCQVRALGINGIGKDTVRRAFARVMDGLRGRIEAGGEEHHAALLALDCFEVAPPAFGTSRMIKDDLSHLSCLRIISEAGINSGTKAGDAPSVRAATMQNSSQDAYSKLSYPGHADRTPSPYGVCTSIFEESTKDAFMDLMGGQVATGEAARMLTFQFDISANGDAQLRDSAPPPDHIIDIFWRLFEEARRGENPLQMWSPGKGPEIPAVSLRPIPEELRRIFRFSPEAEEHVVRLLKERTAFRRANVENVASLDHAQRVRYEQLILRMALILARTRIICGSDAFKPQQVVELSDLLAAQAIVDESRRTEKANGGDYDDPISRLTKDLYEAAVKELERPEASKTYLSKHSSADRLMRIVRSSFFSGGNNTIRRTAQALVGRPGMGGSVADVLFRAAREGQVQGLWELETGKQGYILTLR